MTSHTTSNHPTATTVQMRLPEVEPLPPMSRQERVARGLAAPERAPLASHGQWRPSKDRVDTVSVLERQVMCPRFTVVSDS